MPKVRCKICGYDHKHWPDQAYCSHCAQCPDLHFNLRPSWQAAKWTLFDEMREYMSPEQALGLRGPTRRQIQEELGED